MRPVFRIVRTLGTVNTELYLSYSQLFHRGGVHGSSRLSLAELATELS